MYAASLSVHSVSSFAAVLHKSALGTAHVLNACVSSTVLLDISSAIVLLSVPGKLRQMSLTRTLCQDFVRNFRLCLYSLCLLSALRIFAGAKKNPWLARTLLLGQ